MPIPMTYSKTGEALTESFESCRLASYQDSTGLWTIGWGHTHGVRPGMTCTQAQADAWLLVDMAWAESVVNRLVTIALSQNEFDALVDFVFNCGSDNFAHSTLLILIDRGFLKAAAREFEKWDHAGGKVVAGLLRRRIAEEREFDSIG